LSRVQCGRRFVDRPVDRFFFAEGETRTGNETIFKEKATPDWHVSRKRHTRRSFAQHVRLFLRTLVAGPALGEYAFRRSRPRCPSSTTGKNKINKTTRYCVDIFFFSTSARQLWRRCGKYERCIDCNWLSSRIRFVFGFSTGMYDASSDAPPATGDTRAVCGGRAGGTVHYSVIKSECVSCFCIFVSD